MDPRQLANRSNAVLQTQLAAILERHPREYAATWAAGPRARRLSRTVAANVSSMDIVGLHARVVRSSLRVDQADELAPSTYRSAPTAGLAWRLDVDLRWRFGAFRTGAAHSRLTYTFEQPRSRVVVRRITAAGGADRPLWLLGHLEVRRSRHLLAAAGTFRGADQLFARLALARRDLRRVLPRWHGDLAAVLPPSTADFDDLLAASRSQYSGIAAVTTTVDGSTDPAAPVAIVLNPHGWRRLRPVGARVVITHEATHDATGSVTSQAPRWLTEGFADYVAIRSAHVPVSVASAAAVRRIRADGVPRQLPTNADFAASNPRLESTYELSRLAIQAMQQRVGTRRLTSFYLDVVEHPADVSTAWRSDLGITRSALTRDWRRLLVGLVGAN